MIQTVFIINNSGEIIIEKHYQGVLSRTVAEQFWAEIVAAPSRADVLPIITTTSHYLAHILKDDIYFVAVLENETSPLFVFDFLQRIIDIFQDYFGSVNEASIKEHFVSVYSLLEEMMDSGMPMTTEPNVLKELVRPPASFLAKVAAVGSGVPTTADALPEGQLSNVPWRKIGVKHTSNEIFFDISEEVDAVIDASGMAVNFAIAGVINMNVHLSGMPDLTLIFKNPRLLEDVSFHPCVRLARFEQERVVSFVPADGESELMRYRVNQQTQLPLYCKPQISYSGDHGLVNVVCGTRPMATDIKVDDVTVIIPFPKAISSANLEASVGKVKYDEISKTATWTIGGMSKSAAKIPTLTGSIILPSGVVVEGNPNVRLQFKFPTTAISGLEVATLGVAYETYKPYKGVRAFTTSGNFEIRC
eukprot:c54170_g1_i1.p1 GENE.c54170_g1_i1~~c54170_g1_i1.p1  ORF type:complete len:438 (+),score=101.44 c54170_g1_i1:61-1314(+)